MAIGAFHSQAAEWNSTGSTYIALPVNDASISGKEYNSADSGTVGSDTTKVTTGGFMPNASLQLYEGTGATAASKLMLDWFLSATRAAKTLRLVDPSSAVGASQVAGDFLIESIENWFQVEAASADAKYMTISMVGGSDLTTSTVATASGLTPAFTPIPKHLGLIKVTSGTLVTIADIKSAKSTLKRPTQAYHRTNTDSPAGALQGAYTGEVTITVLVDPAAATDYTKLLALVDSGTVACELYSPTSTASSGSNKFAGNFTFTKVTPIGKTTFNDANPRTADFLMKLDGALTFTQV